MSNVVEIHDISHRLLEKRHCWSKNQVSMTKWFKPLQLLRAKHCWVSGINRLTCILLRWTKRLQGTYYYVGNASNWYTMVSVSHFYFLTIHTSLRRECIPRKINTIKWHVGCCIVYHVIENTVANPIDAAHGGKLGVNTIEHIMAFLCSDKAVYFGYQ